MQISFRIPGRLRGQGRPRFVKATGHAYKDAKTETHESIVHYYAGEAMRKVHQAKFEGPVKISIAVRMNHPRSWSAKRKRETIFITSRPDASNQLKLIEDSCNTVVWGDDAQVAQIEIDRRYQDGPEYVDVKVDDLSDVVRARPYSFSETCTRTKPAAEEAT